MSYLLEYNEKIKYILENYGCNYEPITHKGDKFLLVKDDKSLRIYRAAKKLRKEILYILDENTGIGIETIDTLTTLIRVAKETIEASSLSLKLLLDKEIIEAFKNANLRLEAMQEMEEFLNENL